MAEELEHSALDIQEMTCAACAARFIGSACRRLATR
jgi:hypothetical protein